MAKTWAVLVAALACILALPGLARAAFVPPRLLSQAAANAAATLNVVVLGEAADGERGSASPRAESEAGEGRAKASRSG